MRLKQVRFWIVVALLAGAALFLKSRSRAESLPVRSELDSFPLQIGGWTGTNIYVADDIRKILGEGDFLQRVYRRSPDEPGIDLFVAYFPSQRSGSSIHSPKNCLPGAGWVPVESDRIALRRPEGETVFVNRYIIQKETSRQLVLYWYQSQGRIVANEYWAKFYLVADAIRFNRSDGGLVRIITGLDSDESVASGERRAVEFTRSIFPILANYIPQ